MKGIQCSEKNKGLVCAETIKEAVLKETDTVIPQALIRRNKRSWDLKSNELEKRFRLTYSKRRRLPNSFNTLPFGWID